MTRLILTFVQRSALWLTVFALAATPVGRNDYAGVALILAAYFLPAAALHLIVPGNLRARLSGVPGAVWALLLGATATGLWWLAANGAYADAGATAILAGSAALVGLFAAPADLALRTGSDADDTAGSLVERSVITLVPIPAAVLSLLSPAAAALVAAGLFLLAAVGLLAVRRAAPATNAKTPGPARVEFGRRLLLYHAAAFASGALVAALLSLLLVAPGAAMLALVGIGLLIGTAPMPRVLLRVSAPAVILGTSAAAAILVCGLLLMGQPWYAQPAWTIIVAFPLLGIVAASQDAVRRIAVRRLASPGSYDAVAHRGRGAMAGGQFVGALAVLLGALAGLSAPGMVMGVAAGQFLIVGLVFVVGGVRANLQVGGLSTLPVKSVVHKLSWATNPAAQSVDLTGAGPRERRLARWIGRHVELERLSVTLPVSGRGYTIYRPIETSRESLFEAGRADPDKQMPYWAKVWPSGVALADVVAERAGQVKSARVLELGAGLGVTACAVLEAGGQLMTADYSALPLAICRLNTLTNTNHSPRATCFNWRHAPEVERAMASAEFAGGFPLILAADVLYEGRDAIPLLHVIEQLLTPRGELWLAEPVRRTAQRFLDAAAERGWEIDSRQVTAAWPDATDGPVNLHFLRRSNQPDAVAGDLGGWRI